MRERETAERMGRALCENFIVKRSVRGCLRCHYCHVVAVHQGAKEAEGVRHT